MAAVNTTYRHHYFQDLRGKTFGWLKVTALLGSINGRLHWKAVCRCGRERIVTTHGLKHRNIRDCGCRYRPPWEQRFWSKVRKSDDGCWEWTGSLDKNGYGQVWIGGKYRKPHRVTYELTFGNICDGFFVCHKCDNPACVRPDHLFLGTIRDNNNDRTRKGRSARGEKVWTCVLTAEKVSEIRRRYEAGNVTQRELASEYGVRQTTIGRIVLRQTWTHVP